ncbi:MAG: SDR family NAD(P)-dependent oxidoreductase [Candidatus Abyssobacteria bacterium SURF_17]|jgi:NAD(P)-dependent dehydrogenase (short-subunit alcohol dehydrogenase family)|uniref:SDR family NAD(P)-dependent oxidoreductase n=1 Tax=Candidatus Abyssobacteria bacterium SURF_17 TaxID=2093361 RepID=A0A419F8A3_9BACT|nr:MAG: SDR family NAD(P)-dependent oxidoreductase [Candidatus Abyssubacteria bacterium SURF_17]
MGLLDGKVAIVTGSGGGIGRCHALALAKEGAKIVVNDVGGDRSGSGGGKGMADHVVDEIKAAGGQAVANYDSVTSMEGGKNIVKTAIDAFGRLDILVNNAGILRDKTLLKMEENMWDAVIAVHLKGTFACTQPAAAFMKDQGQGGRIINTSSTSGLIGNFGQSNYGAAKAGIAGFTRVCAQEFIKYGITVNALVPVAKTRMTEDLPAFANLPEGALDPAHISPVLVFLASDLAKDINGKFFLIRGPLISAMEVKTTEGASKDGMWTPQEIAKSIDKIMAW